MFYFYEAFENVRETLKVESALVGFQRSPHRVAIGDWKRKEAQNRN